jgi:hypothetical protein
MCVFTIKKSASMRGMRHVSLPILDFFACLVNQECIWKNVSMALVALLCNRASILTGWWLSHPSEKYEFVSWDDEIPNIWKVIKAKFQTTNQLCFLFCLAIELPLNSRFRKRAPTVPQVQVSLRSSRSKSTRPPWSSPRTKACATVGINKTWWNWL